MMWANMEKKPNFGKLVSLFENKTDQDIYNSILMIDGQVDNYLSNSTQKYPKHILNKCAEKAFLHIVYVGRQLIGMDLSHPDELKKNIDDYLYCSYKDTQNKNVDIVKTEALEGIYLLLIYKFILDINHLSASSAQFVKDAFKLDNPPKTYEGDIREFRYYLLFLLITFFECGQIEADRVINEERSIN